MQPIPPPPVNYRHPDRVLAQTVAAHSDWQQQRQDTIEYGA